MSDLPTPKTKDERQNAVPLVMSKAALEGMRTTIAHGWRLSDFDQTMLMREVDACHGEILDGFPDPGEEAGRTELPEMESYLIVEPGGRRESWNTFECAKRVAEMNGARLYRLGVVEEIPVAQEEPKEVVGPSGQRYRVVDGVFEEWRAKEWIRSNRLEAKDACDPAVQALLSTLGGSNG